MRAVALSLLAAFALAPAPAADAADRAALAATIQKLADDYVATWAEVEHTSGISISVSLPGDPATVDVVAGHVSRDPEAAPTTPATLFQIGSITKSFTAAALLQLQTEGKLDLDDTLGEWLPEYPAWKDVSIRRLLNMTSGVPTYDDTAANRDSVAAIGLDRRFTPEILVGFVDPTYPGAPAPTTGYDYSNTNYALAGMIIEKAAGRSVAQEFADRFFGASYGLTDTYYAAGPYPDAVTDRMAAGYLWEPEITEMKPLLGQDMRLQDMS